MQTNKTKFKQNPQVLLWFPERNLQGFLKGLPARHSCKGSSKGFLQRFRQKFQHQSQQGIFVFNCLPQREKKQKKTLRRCRSCLRIGSSKAAELFRQSSSQTSSITTRHIKQSKKNDVHTRNTQWFTRRCSSQRFQQQGFRKVPARFHHVPAELQQFQQVSSEVLTRHHQGSTEVRFHRVPARLQHGSSKVPEEGPSKVPGLFRFFGACIFLSPLPGPRD